MPGQPTIRPSPFRADAYTLEDAGLHLSPPCTGEADELGEALSRIDPWVRYGVPGEVLARLFRPSGDGGIHLAVRRAATTVPIGIVIVRHPWLAGPYLQFLGLRPEAQGKGIGRRLLRWFEDEARAAGARYLWICTSAFNAGALALYQRTGFETAATLDALITPEIDELLLRKRL